MQGERNVTGVNSRASRARDQIQAALGPWMNNHSSSYQIPVPVATIQQGGSVSFAHILALQLNFVCDHCIRCSASKHKRGAMFDPGLVRAFPRIAERVKFSEMQAGNGETP